MKTEDAVTVGQGLKPNVLLLITTFLPESYAGAEQQTRRFAAELLRQGGAVGILTSRQLRETPAETDDCGVSVERVYLKGAPNLGGRHMWSFLGWSLKVVSLCWKRRRTLGVIHIIHGRLHAVPAVVCGWLLNKPVVIKLGRSGEHFDLDRVRAKKGIGVWLAPIVAGRTSVFVANSSEIREDLRRWSIPEERIAFIPNGVTVPAAYPAERDLESGGPVRFVYAGRLDPEKAVDLLLRAFAALPAEADWVLDVLGDGSCLAGLKEQASSLGFGDKVRFHGAVSDVASWFRRAHYYVSTSLSEGMSNSLLEAMSQGAVPVVTKAGGVLDVVRDGECGLLAEPGDESGYARQLHQALNLSVAGRQKMSRQAWERMATDFDLAVVVRRHRELYAQLLAARS